MGKRDNMIRLQGFHSLPKAFLHKVSGQSLVEFVMVAPILILMLLAAFTVGMAVYHGSSAGSAMQEVVMNKTALADTPGSAIAVAQQKAQAYQDGNINTGNGIDSMSTDYQNNVTAVLYGSKRYTNPLLATDIEFVSVQGINANLLKANNPTYDPNMPALPVVNLPDPSAFGLTLQDIPPNLVLSEVCSLVGSGGSSGGIGSCQGLSNEECTFQHLVAYLRDYIAAVQSTYPDICTETSLNDPMLYTLAAPTVNY